MEQYKRDFLDTCLFTIRANWNRIVRTMRFDKLATNLSSVPMLNFLNNVYVKTGIIGK